MDDFGQWEPGQYLDEPVDWSAHYRIELDKCDGQVKLYHDGVCRTAAAWARHLGVDAWTMYRRLGRYHHAMVNRTRTHENALSILFASRIELF